MKQAYHQRARPGKRTRKTARGARAKDLAVLREELDQGTSVVTILAKLCGNDSAGLLWQQRVRRAMVEIAMADGRPRDQALRDLESRCARSVLWLVLVFLEHAKRAAKGTRQRAISACGAPLFVGRHEEEPVQRLARFMLAWERSAAECEAAGLPVPPMPRLEEMPKRPRCPKASAGGLAADLGISTESVLRRLRALGAAKVIRVAQPHDQAEDAVLSRKIRDGRKSYAVWKLVIAPCARVLLYLRHQWGSVTSGDLERLLGAATEPQVGDLDGARVELARARHDNAAQGPPAARGGEPEHWSDLLGDLADLVI